MPAASPKSHPTVPGITGERPNQNPVAKMTAGWPQLGTDESARLSAILADDGSFHGGCYNAAIKRQRGDLPRKKSTPFQQLVFPLPANRGWRYDR